LETLEEINQENRKAFEAAGGKQFHYIPALNIRDDHVEALVNLILDNTEGWLDTIHAWDRVASESENIEREKRAKALGAKR